MNLVGERREYDAAGALAEELPWWGYLKDGRTCLTRDGQLLCVGRITPSTLDGRTPEALDAVLERWTRLLSNVEPGGRLSFYLLRRPVAMPDDESGHGDSVSAIARRRRKAFLGERLQDVQAYLVWCHDPGLQQATTANGRGPWWLNYCRAWLARSRAPHEAVYLYDEIEAAAARFRQVVDAGSKLVSDLTEIEVLNGRDGGRFLSELVNRPGLPWDGSVSSGMNWSLAVSELDAERRFLRLDGEPVVLYSLLSPPGTARANMLNDLYRLKARMTVSLEWRPYTTEAGRKKINSARKHYFSQRYSMMAHVQETEGSAVAMEDSVASAESDRLSKALVELETDGIAYGDISLSIALHGELGAIERLDGDIRRIFATHDAKLIREGYGQLAQWFNRLPGQPRSRQLRKVLVSAGAAASLAPLFGPPRGREQSAHLEAPALTTLETHWQTPFHYDLFAGDVGHTLILGATGAGKSFTLNFLLVQALQYRPRVLILDLGGSYRWLTRFLGGGYLELSPDDGDAGNSFRLRPFSLPAGERTFQFLTGWVTRLLRLGGMETSGDDPTEIRSRIEDLYAFPPASRDLSALVRSLPKRMWAAMGRWHGAGTWARYFDNPADGDDMEFADWQVIDLAGAAEHEDLCEAAMFYLLERLRIALEDPTEIARVKLMVVDEAWRYLKDPAVLSYLAEAAKTWRKKNAALIMATQSAVDVTSTPEAAGLLESMPTKIFLANPNLPEKVGEIFRLNPDEMDTIRSLVPKMELYLKRAGLSAILRLEVDRASYWLYTSNPRDSQRRAEMIAEHGLQRALELLGAGQ